MSKTIFYKNLAKKDNFTVLDNTCLHDDRLSLKAKGLHSYLMSLPPDWKLYKSELQSHSADGKDSLDSAIKELIDYGYIEIRKNPREKGKFSDSTYCIYEQPKKTFSAQKFDCTSVAEKKGDEQPETINPHLNEFDNENFSDKSRTDLSQQDAAQTEQPPSENPQLPNTTGLTTDEPKIYRPTTELTNYVQNQKTNFREMIKSLFSGNYPFDNDFESQVLEKTKESGISSDKIKDFLTFVHSRTSQEKVRKSFTGYFRKLALSDSVINDFNEIELCKKNGREIYTIWTSESRSSNANFKSESSKGSHYYAELLREQNSIKNLNGNLKQMED